MTQKAPSALLIRDRSRESGPEPGACPKDSSSFLVLSAKKEKWKNIFFLLDDLNMVIEGVQFQAPLLAKGQHSTHNSLVSAGQKLLSSKGAQW